MTDRDTVAGTVRFATTAAAAGLRPVFGVDVAVAPHRPPSPHRERARTPVRGGAHVMEPPLRITLLAQNAGGWARLCRLVSAAHAQTDGGPPVVSWPSLRPRSSSARVPERAPGTSPVTTRAAPGPRPRRA